jgi:hypothetical protein
VRYDADSAETRAAAGGGEVGCTTSRSTPLTLVSDAVAGEDLLGVAGTVARALGCPIAIAIPALGAPALVPEGSVDEATAAAILTHAEAVAGGRAGTAPESICEAVAVRIADQVVGIVAAVSIAANDVTETTPEPAPERHASGNGGPRHLAARERRAWLEAAATAASVTALIHDAQTTPSESAGAELLIELNARAPEDLAALLSQARRLGVDLRAGAIAICALRDLEGATPAVGPGGPPLPAGLPALTALRAPGRLLTLVPLADEDGAARAQAVADTLRAGGWTVALSGPRRNPTQLHQALFEAELLGELRASEAAPAEQEDTYRLLIGVLLRDRDELQALREQTISPLADYDARHDTDLLATLCAFLTHDGSTTETAEAMALHRHTVGYRLSRVHEVSGLSPYESGGRERLSLGIKAQQIFDAEHRRIHN